MNATDIDWNTCRYLLAEFRREGVRTLVHHGILLKEIREKKAHLVALSDTDQEVFDSSDKLVMSERQCWEQWLRRERGWSYSHAQRLIQAGEFAARLPEEKAELLKGVPARRLFALTTHAGQEKALEAATELSDDDWALWVRQAEGSSEADAEREEEARKDRAREHIKARAKSQFLEQGPWRSKRFQHFVRECPCCVCGLEDFRRVDGAHVVTRRLEDDFLNVVPLCNEHHREQHQHGWERLGIEDVGEVARQTLKAYLVHLEEGEK